MKPSKCKCGLRKNGTWWYQVDGKFVNRDTFAAVYCAPSREEVEADIAAMDAVITPATVCKPAWNYDISPALLLVMGVVVLVFVLVLLGITVGDAKIYKCGTYQYWGGNGVIWFVEDTCRGIR